MSMTFVCLGIAKLECQNITGYFFSLSNNPMYDILKRKKNKNALYMIANVYSMRCGSYRMYLKGDSPHQTVIIVYKLN